MASYKYFLSWLPPPPLFLSCLFSTTNYNTSHLIVLNIQFYIFPGSPPSLQRKDKVARKWWIIIPSAWSWTAWRISQIWSRDRSSHSSSSALRAINPKGPCELLRYLGRRYWVFLSTCSAGAGVIYSATNPRFNLRTWDTSSLFWQQPTVPQ